jgi:uncharacterized protein (DUF2147 family)
MKKITALFVMLAVLGTHVHAVTGRWFTKDDEAIIEIYEEDDLLYGKIVLLQEPTDEQGNEKVDNNNPDPAQRDQKRIGLVIMKNFVQKNEYKWGGGKIYDPDNGKTYACTMKLGKNNTLKIRGYIGVSLLGRTEVWTKCGECIN